MQGWIEQATQSAAALPVFDEAARRLCRERGDADQRRAARNSPASAARLAIPLPDTRPATVRPNERPFPGIDYRRRAIPKRPVRPHLIARADMSRHTALKDMLIRVETIVSKIRSSRMKHRAPRFNEFDALLNSGQLSCGVRPHCGIGRATKSGMRPKSRSLRGSIARLRSNAGATAIAHGASSNGPAIEVPQATCRSQCSGAGAGASRRTRMRMHTGKHYKPLRNISRENNERIPFSPAAVRLKPIVNRMRSPSQKCRPHTFAVRMRCPFRHTVRRIRTEESHHRHVIASLASRSKRVPGFRTESRKVCPAATNTRLASPVKGERFRESW